jgi:hypothetical protein
MILNLIEPRNLLCMTIETCQLSIMLSMLNIHIALQHSIIAYPEEEDRNMIYR